MWLDFLCQCASDLCRFVINVPGEEAGQENYVQAIKVGRGWRLEVAG